MRRDLLAREALGQIPKILTLQDRNPHSPTFGCFDRNFWHYRIVDFPSGMAQELVWPLALAHETDLPRNLFFRQPSVRDWVEAGILYAARSAHPDGSCDDYFPHERAGGAAAFSLLACLESCTLLGLRSDEALRFFGRRADWLAAHHESGRLSNHQALIALCLELAGRVLATSRWERARNERLERVLGWQSPEGWFQEYEGADPGYHTLTLALLARLHELRPSPTLREAVARAVAFAVEFVHPDGSYGGEVGSRNTYNFFPHGFELAGRWMPEALRANDRFLEGLERGLAPCYADDHILGHHAWSYLLAWRDFARERPPAAPRPDGRRSFPGAGLVVDRREGTELYLALDKGGVFKLFRGGALAASDTQVSLLVEGPGGRLRNAVGHLSGAYDVELGEDRIAIRGTLGWAKAGRMTPGRLVALRLLMLGGGRFFPNLVRRLLQRVLITGKRDAPFRFSRVLRWDPAADDPPRGTAAGEFPRGAAAAEPPRGAPPAAEARRGRWVVTDEVRAESWKEVRAAGIGGAQTSIYNVMSRTWQAGQLQRWLDLTPRLRGLAPGETLRVEREL